MNTEVRRYLAVMICLVVGFAVCFAVAASLRLVHPDTELTRRNRLPSAWRRCTAWARSRSLRLWCPDGPTAEVVAAHLATSAGRRLRRLGVSVAERPELADVVVVDRRSGVDPAPVRAQVPSPCAVIVLADARDPAEFRDACVDLAVALRWPDEVARQ